MEFPINGSQIFVDLSSQPEIPDSGDVRSITHHDTGHSAVTIERRADGLFADGKKVVLRLLKTQTQGGRVTEPGIRRKLKGENLANANLLDYLFDNPQLIPEEWKGKTVYFFGTRFSDSRDPNNKDSRLRIGNLYWSKDRNKWMKGYDRLLSGWGPDNPAVVIED